MSTPRTLAAIVRDRLAVPWSRAKEAVESARVTVAGAIVTDAAARVMDESTVEVAARPLRGAAASRTALPEGTLVYVDADIAVVEKPAGLLSCPFEDEKDTLVDRVLVALRRGAQRYGPQGPSLGVVHRLDKETTGLLVFARTLASKRVLQQQFRVHSVERRYVAIAHGAARAAVVDTMLVDDRGDGLRGSYGVFRRPKGPPPRTAQRAITHVRVLETLGPATLVECRLETGRQHQIRIHLSEAGHPLVGERVYVRDYDAPLLAAPRPMLHATRLGLVHPRTGEELVFDSRPPEDFATFLAGLRTGRLRRASPQD